MKISELRENILSIFSYYDKNPEIAIKNALIKGVSLLKLVNVHYAGGVRPLIACAIAATTNNTRNTTNNICAISADTAAMPPKPRIPAIAAMTRNVKAHPSMTNLLS
tara:strand:- start:556 stop:876 length:321 start_codon:yes stop_codon:yes gene_type:complete